MPKAKEVKEQSPSEKVLEFLKKEGIELKTTLHLSPRFKDIPLPTIQAAIDLGMIEASVTAQLAQKSA